MSIGFGEILMILCVAFFVVGPKDMPKVARTVARGVKKLRQLMKSVTEDFEDELQIEEAKAKVASANEEFKRVQAKMDEMNSVIKKVEG